MSELIPEVLVAPSRYVQGRNSIKEIGHHVKLLGKNALLIGGTTALSLTKETISESLEKNGVSIVHIESGVKECTHATIDKLTEIGSKNRAEVIIGVGGGKVADTSKAVASKMRASAVTVPTQVATNADASGLSVVYTEKHEFVEYLFHPRNPDLVLVDTAIIGKAPSKFIRWGMGDALACMFEGEACAAERTAKNIPGGRTTEAAVQLTRLCFDNLMTYGLQAAKDADKKTITPAVEKIIGSVKLLSAIGFESSGLAAAHATHNGMTILPGLKAEHGQLVAFCVISQLILEGRPSHEIDEIGSWVHSIGLPITLEDLGLAAVKENDLLKAAEKACDPHDTMGNMPLTITPGMVRDAIIAADSWGADFKTRCE
ncbi:MAG: glycerol dehydrogenase [Promethearchaeota archaeon]